MAEQIPQNTVAAEHVDAVQAESVDRTAHEHRFIKGGLALALAASALVGIRDHSITPSHVSGQTELGTNSSGGSATEASDTSSTETKVFIVNDSEMYARQFSSDPVAGVLTQSSSPETNASSIAAQLKDEKVESVSVQGSASAEDDGPDAGVTAPSIKNIELAEKRAVVFTPELESALKEAGITAPEIQEATPIEDSWTPDEVAGASALAEQFGYQGYPQMIIAYNNAPSQVPPDVGAFLDKTLQSHRDVKVVVVVDKSNQAHTVAVPKGSGGESGGPLTPPAKHLSETTINNTAAYIPENIQLIDEAPAEDQVASGQDQDHSQRQRLKQGTAVPRSTPIDVLDPPIGHPRNPLDLVSRQNAPQKVGNYTQARSQKQPLPRNYNIDRGSNRSPRGKTVNRRGSGRG